MPGSTTYFGVPSDEDAVNNSEASLMSSRQPPPVAPRTTSVSIQPWQSATPGGDHSYGDNRHARSASMDSLESSGSSSSGGGSSTINSRSSDSTTVEYIPTRTVGKISKLASHNPLQFVKVQSPLYKKAEHQIKLTKEVKITREALKEGEEEWQSNLDNWKSRRRKVSEKVIQRAEEMRQIEAEEQLRQEQYLQQQRKIKKFSEIVEKRSSSRSYNLDLYIGQGDDSGLGGTPEPDDTIDGHHSILRSDTSEGMTSEGESIDSDVLKSDKIPEKDPPKVPQKPQIRLKREAVFEEFANGRSSVAVHFSHCLLNKEDNFSSAEPSDIEGHIADNEAISSEEDISYSPHSDISESTASSFKDQMPKDQNGIKNGNFDIDGSLVRSHEDVNTLSEKVDKKLPDWKTKSFSLAIKPGDNKGFGFTVKGGKDQGCSACIDNVTKYGPADIVGLREGDKIISLNGELAADYSHASLIFSIKQAVYTGILDVIVSRSEKNALLPAEIVNSTSRKSSFAEKLALFSSGINAGMSSGEENKSATSSKSDDIKSESLVLRRRSAFENGKRDCNVAHRRSSCLSQGNSSTIAENVEKRFSADLTLSQYNVQDNGAAKKGPPPPVPVKPKLKPKTFHDINKTDKFKSNGCREEMEYIAVESMQTTKDCSLSVTNHEKHFHNEFSVENINTDNYDTDIKLKISKEETVNLFPSTANNETESFENGKCLETTDSVECNNQLTFSLNNIGELSSDNKAIYQLLEDTQDTVLNLISNETSNSVVEEKVPLPRNSFIETECNIYSESKENELFANSHELDEYSVSDSLTIISMPSAKPSLYDNDFTNFQSNILTPDVSAILPNFSSDLACNGKISITAGDGDFGVSSECDDSIDTSQHVNDDISEVTNFVSSGAYNLNTLNNDEVEESTYQVNNAVNKNINSIDNLEESINNIQLNPSPLCLPLEKIDEDDVISASTTTSSETPDTETVIETLPANLSPLPNDESNGEESSKPLNCQNKELESSTSTFADNSSYASSDPTYLANSPEDIEVYENVPTEACDYISVSDSNQTVYTENQDDEYCRELDESIDQITSLDVIDEIEQRLMHELEQQGEMYEEMNVGLTNQLDDDVNKQWLYFSEEAELLEDLTPRNLEPPREPPPPPPPAEIDIPDQMIMPMARTNSTKRIKKELWRRRSDFLGLDSPEGIDVDNILPPPPGLEEILKREREQNQWLEKRLSLAETDISAPLYANEPVSVEPQDFTQNVYSEYLEENDELDSHCEQWKENFTEDGIFEPSTEYPFVPPPDISAVSDESHKVSESPQHKAKQHLHTLGAAPKAKIMDSNKWITEKVMPVNKKSIEPVFRQTTYNQNYWLAQDDERKKIVPSSDNLADRRYSMPPFSNPHPDVTVRTWGDREYEFQKQRPRSAVWNSSANSGDSYEPYSQKQEIQRTHSLNTYRDTNSDMNTLESEAHKCSCCGKGLCEGSAMGIEALRLYFHIECFRCCLCRMQLGNGSCGTDVQVKNNQLYCPNCFTVD